MRRIFVVALVLLAAGAGLALAEQPRLSAVPASHRPAVGELPGDPVSMVLDDGVFENNIGLNSSTNATQFMWFNRFSPVEFPIEVSRIDIWWDSAESAAVVGSAIDLVVYAGGDTPCTAGPTYLGGQADTVAVLDAFDQYTLTTPVQIASGPSVMLGVVDRYITSGVSPTAWPAALDTTATQGRSFVASYSTDPPAPPTLPSDGLCGTIDSFGFPGNWLIRGAGTVVPVELMRLTIE
jgi:hypothetical protein